MMGRGNGLAAVRRVGFVLGVCIALCGAVAVSPAGASSDTTPPSLWHVSFTPSTVDITSSDAVVTVNLNVTDLSGSGAASGCVGFDEPSTSIPYRGACFNSSNLVSGAPQSGTYQVDITIPRYAHDGFYPIDAITLTDVAGNTSVYDAFDLFLMGQPYGVTVTGTSDVTPPTVVSVEVSSASGDLAAGPFEATVTVHVTDAQSGYSGFCIDFGWPVNPSTPGASACLFEPGNRISGTAQDGVYQSTLGIPQTASPGIYPLLGFHVQDGAENFVNETPAQLEAVGAPSAIVLTNSSDTTPGAPTNVVATAANASAGVSWAPASNGGAQLISYTVTASPGAQTVTVSGDKTSATVPGLSNGSPYSFTVHATNGIGDGAESNPSNSITPAQPPTAPTAIQATAGTSEVDVSWTPPTSDGGSPILGYTVTQSGNCGPNGPHCATVAAASDATSAAVIGLMNGAPYTFTVHATNAIGNSPESASSSSVTTTPGTSTPPQYVSAVAQSGQASLQWLPPTNNGGSPIVSYTVTAIPGGRSVTVPVGPSTTQTATLTGLTNGTTYTFTVHATNAYGDSAESDPSSAIYVFGGPNAPMAAHATAGNGRATVSWTAPAFDGGSAITQYQVTATPGAEVADVAPPNTSLTMTGLSNGTTYTFTVSAVNRAGAGTPSAASNRVTVGTPAAPTAAHAAPGVATTSTGALKVSYTAGVSNGSTVTKFTATCTSSNGGVLKTGVHFGATATPIVVAGLSTKRSYTCSVRETNSRGTGAASVPTAAVIVGAPAAPVAVHAVKVASGQLKVTFTAPAANGAAITSYTVTCRSSNAGVTKTKTGAAGPLTVIGLTAGKTYACTVKATNSRGTGPSSSPSAAVVA